MLYIAHSVILSVGDSTRQGGSPWPVHLPNPCQQDIVYPDKMLRLLSLYCHLAYSQGIFQHCLEFVETVPYSPVVREVGAVLELAVVVVVSWRMEGGRERDKEGENDGEGKRG